MRVALDGTPLLGHRTGIGRYVLELISELSRRTHNESELSLRVAAFSVRQRSGLRDLPPGAEIIHRPVPARLLSHAWLRRNQPSAELVMGRADVVHGTNYVVPPARRAAEVVSVHDLSFLRHPEWVRGPSLRYGPLIRRAVARGASVVTLSAAVAAEVQDAFGLPAERVHVVPLGVRPEWFAAPADVAVPSVILPREYLLAVGTLEPRKGLDVLLQAYRILIGEGADPPPLVLAGPPGWGESLDLQGINHNRVIFTGYLTDRSLRQVLGGANALVFPSRYEGFGLPPLEALASGVPVVASDLPAVREVVGGHVILCRPDDPEALAEGLLALMSSPADPAARQAGRDHARQFSWARCADLTIRAYTETIARRDRARA